MSLTKDFPIRKGGAFIIDTMTPDEVFILKR